MNTTAQPRARVDWPAVNLAVSIAIIAASFFHVGLRVLGTVLPAPVFASVDQQVRAVAVLIFDYGIPFAVALLVVRAFDLAAPLRRAPILSWFLLLSNMALLALTMTRLVIGTSGTTEFTQVAGVLFWAYQSLVIVPAFLAILAAWVFVVYALTRSWWRERPHFHAVVPGEIALIFFFGMALPAAALAPLFPGAEKHHQEYAAQEARFAELCRSTKIEIFETATPPKTAFIDPNVESSFWDVRNGRFRSSSGGAYFAQSLASVGPLDFVEVWDEPYQKPRELKRCDSDQKCETVSSITAKYRVATKEVQSKADETLGVRAYAITVDERETGKVLGRMQFAVSWKTARVCAPDAKEGETFNSRDFVAKALGIKPGLTEIDLGRTGVEGDNYRQNKNIFAAWGRRMRSRKSPPMVRSRALGWETKLGFSRSFFSANVTASRNRNNTGT